jgi:hypothetical protein
MNHAPTAESILTNGHTMHQHDARPAPVPPTNASMNSKKGKQKKGPMDSSETSKLLAARISQLELDAAGEKDQEAEIGAFSPPVYRLGVCRKTFVGLAPGSLGSALA